MARITQLPDTLYAHDFVRLARREQHACTRERLLGMAHLQKQGSLTRTAEALFVHITRIGSTREGQRDTMGDPGAIWRAVSFALPLLAHALPRLVLDHGPLPTS